MRIAYGVAILRSVNPQMFDWLVRALEQPQSADAVAKGSPYCESSTRDKEFSS